MRQAKMSRKTQETDIFVSIIFEGSGTSSVNTGIGFLDHMLVLFAKHSGIDLKVEAEGDLHIDAHHTVEDIGIVIGEVIARALGDKRGIKRYGHMMMPMDEALVSSALDLSGRPFLVFKASFTADSIGSFDTQLIEEFFRAVAFNAGITLHLQCLYGKNDHHIAECLFKAFAHSLAQAIKIDPSSAGAVLSTKGTLS